MSQARVVLLHGLFGFRRFLFWEYFRGVHSLFASLGLQVYATKAPWGADIKTRAQAIARQLASFSFPLHLIAHSMGGLDARYYITHLGGHKKVASLTTLATPHRGSAAARKVSESFSLARRLPGLRCLVPDAMEAFNQNTPDMPGVVYRSYSAARPIDEIPWIVRRYARCILDEEGENDGQVSVASAQWGKHVRTLHADHFELIGLNLWLNPLRQRGRFDHLSLYREIGQWIHLQTRCTNRHG